MKMFLIILTAFFISACACKVSGSATMLGKTYSFNSYNGQAISQAASFQMGEDMQVSGKLCNTFRGPATLENGLIKAQMISTKMFCMDGNINRVESAFFTALAKGASYEVSGKMLTVKDGENIFILEEQ